MPQHFPPSKLKSHSIVTKVPYGKDLMVKVAITVSHILPKLLSEVQRYSG